METTGSITDLDTIGKADLNEKLHHFYGEAKPKHLEKRAKNMPNEHASVYHKNTLKNVRAALNRHIKNLNRQFHIVRDIEFRKSNIILDSTLKMMVRTGLSRATKHKEIIEIDDLQLISTYLFKDINDPILLRQRVWYCLAVHFVSRELEFHHQLNLNRFDFKVDSDGDEYVLIKHETQQNNIEGGITSEEAPNDKFMYASRTNTCPVASLRLLINKTDPNAKSFFNRCVKDLRAQDSVWYTNQHLAKRTYSGFMTDICKNEKCSKVYTTHCLRATSIQAMNDAGHN